MGEASGANGTDGTGPSGVPRARLVVGTMNFGKRTKAPEASAVVARALERGVAAFDTANVYQDGEAERILGAALKAAGARGAAAAVVSKVGLGKAEGGDGGRGPEGLSAPAIRRAAEASLKRLGRERLDGYLLHAPDPATDPRETVEAVGALLRDGLVVRWGVSNFSSWRTLELWALARELGVAPPSSAQQMYNLLVRQIDVEYVPFAARYGIALEAYNPLAGGLLTGRYDDGAEAPKGSRFAGNALYRRRYFGPRLRALAAEYGALARDLGLAPTALAYAWLAGGGVVGSVVVGPGETAHLDAALDGWEKVLDEGARARVDAIHAAYLGTDARYAR